MKSIFLRLIVKITLSMLLITQVAIAGKPLHYYLPDEEFNPAIPTPESFFGFQVGEWHLQHSPLLFYFRSLDAASDRAVLYEYGRTHQQRPLVQLIITSPANHARLEEIRQRHLKLSDPAQSAGLDVSEMPVVVHLGYGVHGNEPSTHNAAPLVAYYLLASNSAKVQSMLDNMVIIIDPSLNPDGQDRFASWVNRHRSLALNPDPANREFHDVWPGSRTNHYWFDLNRDWFPMQHPESYARVKAFHRWLPNVSTDHHEFGPNETFFFQPGVPSRINPLTPQRTNELTHAIALFHARAFDAFGQVYFLNEVFDDFYVGKGSTYPDLTGAIGILFEQASTRGHRQETIHGVIDFSETIKNQVVVSFSSLQAAYEKRQELLEHMRWFFRSALEDAQNLPVAGYIFGDAHDQARNQHFLRVLLNHQIEVHNLSRPVTLNNKTFNPGAAWVVSTHQPHSRLVRTIFETATTFTDSIFYDVSTWNLPLAFHIPYEPVANRRLLAQSIGERKREIHAKPGQVIGDKSLIGYVFEWNHFYAPKALFFIQRNHIRTRVASESFTILSNGEKINMGAGSIFIPTQIQDIPPDQLYNLITEAALKAGVEIYALTTSYTLHGIDMGSDGFAALDKPEILMVAGPGVDSRDAGEIWHLLDYRYNIPVTKVEPDRLGGIDLTRYNTIILPPGRYDAIAKPVVEALNRWLRNGGTLIALEDANNWLHRNEIVKIEFIEMPEFDDPDTLPYLSRSFVMGARRIPGTIFRSIIDITHPIGFGYRHRELPVFITGTNFAKPAESPFANPLMLPPNNLISGYMPDIFRPAMENSAGIIINRQGRGNVISFMFNPNFRGFWFGTNRLFMNALFFGEIIRR